MLKVLKPINNPYVGMDKIRTIIFNGIPNINIKVTSSKDMIYILLSFITKRTTPLNFIPNFMSLPLVGSMFRTNIKAKI